MSENGTARFDAVKFFKNCALLLCLIAPSAWMILTIPPLWRDADAYVQLTENPLVVTFWGHAPGYSYATKPFLFAGEQWDRWQGRASAKHHAESSQPGLTDTGIWLIIIGQHLALAAALFCFVRAVSQFFWVRLALAVAWATNPMLYTYAHCLGSETLSAILTVVLATKGLRLLQARRQPEWKDWYFFAVVLCFCIFTRELNLGLIALLPVAFVIAWNWNRPGIFRSSKESEKFGSGERRAPYLWSAVVAIAIGFACVWVEDSLEQNLARKTKLHPHSRIGFTFLWRLNFLDNLSPEARGALLGKVAARAHSEKARQIIALLGQMQAEKVDMSAGPFMQRAILLFNGPQWEELDGALNEMAFAFLLPPTPEHLQATSTDLIHAVTMPPTEITNYLFATTTYYFEHREELHAVANLGTFRGETADQIRAIPSQHLYFRLWQEVRYSTIFLVWVIALASFVFVARRRGVNPGAITGFSFALTAAGILICVTACVLHEIEPRFALTMWQTLLLSISLLLGKTADMLILEPARPRAGGV
jgi:hypothetical protein